ncbi:MAG: hypothetical protein KC505_01615 [Myxococcales bacterium]|nr:hypothetical protein [Myxococcales bacterium]USN50150.1 MAG: hypothetical protein H6731_07720 [Myxococcales bacterium]
MARRVVIGIIFFLSGCLDKDNLAKSSLGSSKDAPADPSSVISMGRDDDDGMALKWHIGG